MEDRSGHEAFLIDLSEKVVGQVRTLSEPEQVFVRVWELEAEVNNGGFYQYYSNSAGDFALEATGALRQIGAQKMATFVERANALFPGGSPPRDEDARKRWLDGLKDLAQAQLNSLDEEFFGYPEDLSQLLYDFVMKHRGEFADLD